VAACKSRRRRLLVDWERGFGQELPFPDSSVDRVFSSLMLHHLDPESQSEFLAEIRRVLRTDGVLVLADLARHRGDHGPGDHGRDDHRHDRPGTLRHLLRRSVAAPADAQLVAQLGTAGFRTDAPSVYPLAGLAITVVRAQC